MKILKVSLGLLFISIALVVATYFVFIANDGQICAQGIQEKEANCAFYKFGTFILFFWLRFFDLYNGLIQGLAAITVGWFTFFLMRIGKFQADISSKQTSIAQAQARAFISIERIEAEINTMGDQKYVIDDGEIDPLHLGLSVTRFAIQPIWKNSGTTATKNMRVNVNWRGHGGSLAPDFDYGYAHDIHWLPAVMFLGPKSSERGVAIEIPTESPNKIINGEHQGLVPMMFVWGRADYEDIFGGHHFIEWCYQIRFLRLVVGERLQAQFIQWGVHNRSGEHPMQKT